MQVSERLAAAAAMSAIAARVWVTQKHGSVLQSIALNWVLIQWF